MTTIPMDVIQSCILPRLPVKSLIRFKSVSKSWQTIISSAEFIHLHHQHALSSDANRLIVFKKDLFFHAHELDSPLPPSLLCYYPDCKPYTTIDILASSEFFLLINMHSSHGLILLNPSTGRYYKIPYPPDRHPHESRDECYGIYLDFANKDFKIVRIFRNSNTYIEAMVYSLRDNIWRLIESRFDMSRCYRVWHGASAVIRHLLHIPVVPSSREHFMTNIVKRIGCFDILAENWTNDVPFPHLDNLEWTELSVLDGLLCVTGVDRGETIFRNNYTVWVMKEYGVKDSWFKLINIAYKGSLYLDCYPIAYRTGSRHEVLCRRITNNEYIWYNIRDKKATPTTLDRVIPKATTGIHGYICKGSLVDFPGGRNMKVHQPK